MRFVAAKRSFASDEDKVGFVGQTVFGYWVVWLVGYLVIWLFGYLINLHG